MVEEIKKQPIPDILTLASKEKFRRKLLIATRVIAIFLVLAIFWIGILQITYTRDVNKIRSKYGSLGYCYMCGLETLRVCECQYRPDIERSMPGKNNVENLSKQAALASVALCVNLNPQQTLNITGVNISHG